MFFYLIFIYNCKKIPQPGGVAVWIGCALIAELFLFVLFYLA